MVVCTGMLSISYLLSHVHTLHAQVTVPAGSLSPVAVLDAMGTIGVGLALVEAVAARLLDTSYLAANEIWRLMIDEVVDMELVLAVKEHLQNAGTEEPMATVSKRVQAYANVVVYGAVSSECAIALRLLPSTQTSPIHPGKVEGFFVRTMRPAWLGCEAL